MSTNDTTTASIDAAIELAKQFQALLRISDADADAWRGLFDWAAEHRAQKHLTLSAFVRALGLPPSAIYEQYLSRATRGTYVPSAREGSRGWKLRQALQQYRERLQQNEPDVPPCLDSEYASIKNIWKEHASELPAVSRLSVDTSSDRPRVVCLVQPRSAVTAESLRQTLRDWGASVDDNVDIKIEELQPLLGHT